MGKFQIKSYCQILDHLINRSFSQISDLKSISSSNLKSFGDISQVISQIFNFRFNFVLAIFHY